MILRICLRAALAAILLAADVSSIAQAEGLRAYLRGYQTLSTADDAVLADLSKYYRIHANVLLGRESRLGNGVAWRVLTDVRTGAAAPRITWMSGRKGLVKANALFEAIHGDALVGYDIEDLERRRMELYEWHNGKPPDVSKPPYFATEKLVVTYATSRLVSYVEVRREFGSTLPGVDVYGRVLDLERGAIKEIEGCRNLDDTYKNFRFVDFLDVCAERAYDSFMALWMEKVRQAATNAQASADELLKNCDESMEGLIRYNRRMALYLTPTGVAVFRHCMFNNVAVNPIVLPYRELESFIIPGPWRDELLK